ncbi:hypothetical protein HK102_008238 [Quaeritorhiza haematococci]|nr:hypothetical protein HK102_008238 [Quaeritorhiza haematococci]
MSFAAVSAAITGESGIMDRERFVPIENETALALARDWKSLYRYRSLAESLFQAVYVDVGAYETKFGGLGIMAYVSPKYRDISYKRGKVEEPDTVEFGKLRSLVRRALGHYWSAGSGYYEIEVGVSTRQTYAPPQKPYYYQGVYRPPTKEGEPQMNLQVVESIVMFIYGHMFEKELSPRQHPLLLAIPPFMSEIERNTLYAILFSYLWIPYISLVDSAILTMHAHGCGNGTAVVVSIGALHAWVEFIVDGKPLNKGPVPVVYIDGEQITRATEAKKTSYTRPPLAGKVESRVADVEKLAQTFASWIFDGANATPIETRKALFSNIIVTGGLAKPMLQPLQNHLHNLIHKDRTVAGSVFASFHLSENPALDNVRGAEVFLSLPTARDSFVCIDKLPARLVELAASRNFTLDHTIRRPLPDDEEGEGDDVIWWGIRSREWEIQAWKFTMEQIFQAFGRKLPGEYGRHLYGLRFGPLRAGAWVDDGKPGVDDPTRFCAMVEGREVKDEGAVERRKETINNLVVRQSGRPVVEPHHEDY